MPGFPPSLEEGSGLMVGALIGIFSNIGNGYTAFTRLPRLAVLSTAGYFVGIGLTQFKENRIKTKEVYMWDYINKHPDDFPEIFGKEEPKKLKNLLETWVPIR